MGGWSSQRVGSRIEMQNANLWPDEQKKICPWARKPRLTSGKIRNLLTAVGGRAEDP